MVPERGLEPPPDCSDTPLKRARLPISPLWLLVSLEASSFRSGQLSLGNVYLERM
jgi:hypothetical protein